MPSRPGGRRRRQREGSGGQAQRQRVGGRLLLTRSAEYITVGGLGHCLAKTRAYLDYLVHSTTQAKSCG